MPKQQIEATWKIRWTSQRREEPACWRISWNTERIFGSLQLKLWLTEWLPLNLLSYARKPFATSVSLFSIHSLLQCKCTWWYCSWIFLNLQACAVQKVCESLPSSLSLWLPSTQKVSLYETESLFEIESLFMRRLQCCCINIFSYIWLWSDVLPTFSKYLIQKTIPLFHFITISRCHFWPALHHQFALVMWFDFKSLNEMTWPTVIIVIYNLALFWPLVICILGGAVLYYTLSECEYV